MRKSLTLVCAGCVMVSRIFLRRFAGDEYLPAKGQPAIVAANHSSLFDGVTLCAELTWRTHRPMHPLVTREAFAPPFSGWILRSTQAVPIDRRDPRDTENALRTLLGYLGRGEQVTIFPEGHLNNGQTMRLPRPGMALLALESGAPVIPCGLRGTAEAFPVGGRPRWRRSVEIHMGEPVPTKELSDRYHGASAPERRELVNRLSREVMLRIAALSGMRPHRRMA